MRLRFLLAGLFATSFTIGTDATGVGVLLQPIDKELHTTISTTQWVISAYALAFAMMMVTGGRLADMFGRRRLLLIGLAVFTLAALANALSSSVGFLIGSRSLQGIGGAILWPSVVGLLFLSVPPQKAGTYMGVLLGLTGLGNVVAPIVGGAVSDLGPRGWRLFFVFNALTTILAIALVLLGTKGVEKESLKKERIDFVGIVVLGGALAILLLALDFAPEHGWASARVLGLLSGAAIGLAAFRFVERKVSEPLIPPTLWRNRVFVAAVLLNGLQIGCGFFVFAFLPQLGQRVWGYSDLRSGLLLLPLLACFAGFAPVAGRLYDRIGPRVVIGTGYASLFAGCLWGALVSPDQGYGGWLVPALLAIGIGCSLTIGPSGTVVVSSVPEEQVALASGIGFQWHLTAGAIGIAVATLIVTSSVQREMRNTLETEGHRPTAQELGALHGIEHSNPQAVITASDLPTKVKDQLKKDAAIGFEDGFQKAYWFGAGCASVALLLVPVLPARRRR